MSTAFELNHERLASDPRLAEIGTALEVFSPIDSDESFNRYCHLKPGMEHCLIGTENLLVFERSIDPKGMDQDLIFIYEPASA